MLFGEKYGDIVRVVEIPGYSTELCGGTHVSSTAEIGPFVLLSESSVGSGTRRVEAVTSGAAWSLLDERARELESLRAEVDRLRKAPKAAPPPEAQASVPEPDVRVESGVNVIVQPIDGLDADALLELSDRYKQKHAPAAVVLGSREDGKVHLVANFDSAVAERVSASDVLREAAAIVGGGGGGRPTMARAGGKDPEKLPDALAEAERLIVDAL
jgi:alanyl-tRNA synthetase